MLSVMDGRTGGSLARFTDQKVTNHESQISNFHFSFESHNQHVKYRFLCCAYAKRKVVKEFLKNISKVAKRKSKTTNSNLQKFINFI